MNLITLEERILLRILLYHCLRSKNNINNLSCKNMANKIENSIYTLNNSEFYRSCIRGESMDLTETIKQRL